MSKFKILVCEDLEKDKNDIGLFILEVNRRLPKVDISYEIVGFSEVLGNLEKEYDLLILDLSDNENGSSGDNVIMHNDGKNKIPTLIYTSTGDNIAFDFEKKQIQFTFLLKKIVKIPNDGSNLKIFLNGYIITSTENNHYQLYNHNDTYLQLSIKYIGLSNFKYILHTVYLKFNSVQIIVYPMNSGWSGAVLFKLKIGVDTYILKLSKDIESLKTEHQKGIDLYTKFPTHLKNDLETDEFYSFDETVFGILLKSVANPETLQDFVTNPETEQSKINDILKQIYLDADCLKYTYASKTSEKKDWTAIFSKIDEIKIQKVKESYKEIKPIINKFDDELEIENFRRISITYDFGNLNPSNLLDDKYQKELVLSHGDFHPKNILIQSHVRPVIIDTGALGYQHWALDITRLLVSFFILGLDKNQVDYFDVHRIPYYIQIAEKIISNQPIEINEGDDNSNVLYTINWIINNIESIYGSKFSLFEFQLGLVKEFLQISYRVDTVPPNKRATALIIANKCLNEANNNALA